MFPSVHITVIYGTYWIIFSLLVLVLVDYDNPASDTCSNLYWAPPILFKWDRFNLLDANHRVCSPTHTTLFPPPCFTVCLIRYYTLPPSCPSPYVNPSVSAINLKLGSISELEFIQSSTVKCLDISAHPGRLASFPLPKKCFWNCCSSSETTTTPAPCVFVCSPGRTVAVRVLLSLFSKFLTCDEVVFLSLRELDALKVVMVWSRSAGLDRALDASDPVCAESSGAQSAASSETFSPAAIFCCLFRTTFWLLTLSLSSDAVSPTITEQIKPPWVWTQASAERRYSNYCKTVRMHNKLAWFVCY